ncbi:MAG TPA: TonB-dependent receptor [Novosphingobium sp.]|nr:TonB-dependent receptor [Novosphingobium sp.]
MEKSRLSTPSGARRATLLGCSALAAVSIGGQAHAQATDSEGYGVADIIVTAQKREQSMQDVPVAITAISAESLQVNRVVNLLDLSSQAPNLAIRTTSGGIGTPTYTLRGSLTYGSVTGQDKAVGVYQDGVYLGFAQGSAFDFPELERIEVLRGPQGTLFGRNSTAGAISIVTRDPTGELGLRQQFTYGNYNHFRTSTTVNLPAMGPFSVMLNYTHSERDGEIRNLDPGHTFDFSAAGPESWVDKIRWVSPKRMGDRNSEAAFAAVKFEPSDTFKMVYKFDYNQVDYTPDANYLVTYIPAFFGPFGNVLQEAYKTYPLVQTGENSRASAVHNGWSTPGYLKQIGHNLTTTWEASDSVTVKNIFGYRKGGLVVTTDVGGHTAYLTQAAVNIMAANAGIPPAFLASFVGAPLPFYGIVSEAHVKQWSDEIQVNYDSEPLTLTVGGIYFKINTSDGSPQNLNAQYFTTPVPGGVTAGGKQQRSYFEGKSLAGYAQAEVHLTPQLDVIGGFRITRDKKDGISNTIAGNPEFLPNGTKNPLFRAPPGSQLTFTSHYRATKATYMLGVNYKITDDTLLFAKYSTGFMSGGSVAGLSYDPETVKSWEAGIKADLFDRRLRANLSLFRNKFKNLQYVSGGRYLPVQDLDLVTLILREGDFRAQGFELELTAVPTRGLTLSGALGYADTKFSNMNTLVRNTDEPLVRPKWTANFSAQYDTQPLVGDAYLMFRLDGNYRTKTRQLQSPVAFDNTGKPIFNQTVPFPNSGWDMVAFSNSLLVLNGRVALRDISVGGAKAEVALWGRNLTNQIRVNQAIDFQVAAVTTYTPARTYGVDLTFEF